MENYEDEIITYPAPKLERYTIPSYELDSLAKGAQLPAYFNISIFLLSLAGSLLGSVLVPISEKGFVNSTMASIVLFVIACVLFLFGVILLGVWIKRGKDVSKVFQEIKSRVPKNTASTSKIISSGAINLGDVQETKNNH